MFEASPLVHQADDAPSAAMDKSLRTIAFVSISNQVVCMDCVVCVIVMCIRVLCVEACLNGLLTTEAGREVSPGGAEDVGLSFLPRARL